MKLEDWDCLEGEPGTPVERARAGVLAATGTGGMGTLDTAGTLAAGVVEGPVWLPRPPVCVPPVCVPPECVPAPNSGLECSKEPDPNPTPKPKGRCA